jgi:methylthioribose-1-phosphate isomerase
MTDQVRPPDADPAGQAGASPETPTSPAPSIPTPDPAGQAGASPATPTSPASSIPTPAPASPAPVSEPDRRTFFRLFAGDVMSSVGSVLGAAQLLQQQSAEAARELLGTGVELVPGPASGAVVVEQPAAGAGFRAPFRWDGDVCRVVDQRRLPDTLVDLEIRTTADAVGAIRDGALVGGPAQAQLAAVAIALVASRSVTSRPFARRATIRGAGNALRNARPASAAVTSTIARMLALLDTFEVEADGTLVAAALHHEAEAVIREATDAHGALVEHALPVLPGGADGALHVLTIGSTGPMAGGQLGTALSVIIAAHHAARPIHALIAETRPGFEGSRIAAWELQEAGVAHALVTDGAAPGCIAGEVEAVLVGADRVASNGDLIAVSGTYPIALAASAAGVPVIVCAPTSAIDLELATGADVVVEQGRPTGLLYAAGTRVAPQGSRIRAPLQEQTPAALISTIVTEEGVIQPPFGPGLRAHVEAVAARRAAAPNPFRPTPTPDLGAAG